MIAAIAIAPIFVARDVHKEMSDPRMHAKIDFIFSAMQRPQLYN